MTQIHSYLNFQGNTREAMGYYAGILGGEVSFQTIGESPIAGQCPAAMQHQVLHSTLSKNGVLLIMASDMIGPEGFTKGNNISLSVNCSSEEEINHFFNKFSADGKVIDPLKKQFWGAIFGVVNDKYDIRWLFNYQEKQ
ncbi:MAG: VOC family protein [Bacteroidota bacterium]